MQRMEEEEGTHPLVEVVVGAPEAIELVDGGEQLVEGRVATERIEGEVAHIRVGRGDHLEEPVALQHSAHRSSSRVASSSTIWASTSSRSRPRRISASWARNRPYCTPML